MYLDLNLREVGLLDPTKVGHVVVEATNGLIAIATVHLVIFFYNVCVGEGIVV